MLNSVNNKNVSESALFCELSTTHVDIYEVKRSQRHLREIIELCNLIEIPHHISPLVCNPIR